MPLTRKQFDLAINKDIEDWMKRIHVYLSEHKDLAFTKFELIKELGAWKQPSPPLRSKQFEEDFEKALLTLVEMGAAEIGNINDTHYYIVGKRPLDL